MEEMSLGWEGVKKNKAVPLGYFVLGLGRRDGMKQCMVGRGEKMRKNPGLSV